MMKAMKVTRPRRAPLATHPRPVVRLLVVNRATEAVPALAIGADQSHADALGLGQGRGADLALRPNTPDIDVATHARKNLAVAAKRHEIEVDLGVEKRQTRPYLLFFKKDCHLESKK